MTSALAIVLVALGGGAGAAARYAVHHLLRVRLSATSAMGTMAVNVFGSFVMGLLVGAGAHGGTLALLGIGFCGAFTTFSTMALDLWSAIDEGRPWHAATNLIFSLLLGLGAAWAGIALTS